MKSHAAAAMVMLAAVASSPLGAQNLPPMESGSDLLRVCEENYEGYRPGCYGALAGITHGQERALPEWQCVPKDIWKQSEQLRLLFVREAHRMPEILHLPARQLVYYAVAKAFPCPLQRIIIPKKLP